MHHLSRFSSKSGKTSQCKNCKGTGFSSENTQGLRLLRAMHGCGGTGQKIEDPCTDCNGSGTVHRTRSITVRIPAGVIDGQKVRLAGQGEAGPNGTPVGDLFVAVKVKPDKVFTREGDDLHVTVPVSFAELALGDTITVPTLDSRSVSRFPRAPQTDVRCACATAASPSVAASPVTF